MGHGILLSGEDNSENGGTQLSVKPDSQGRHHTYGHNHVQSKLQNHGKGLENNPVIVSAALHNPSHRPLKKSPLLPFRPNYTLFPKNV